MCVGLGFVLFMFRSVLKTIVLQGGGMWSLLSLLVAFGIISS